MMIALAIMQNNIWPIYVLDGLFYFYVSNSNAQEPIVFMVCKVISLGWSPNCIGL